MITISHYILCSDVIIDKITSEASYIRVIEEYATESLPFFSGRFFVCACIESDIFLEGIALQISSISPSKSIEPIGAFSIPQKITRAKIQAAVDNAQFKEFGKFEIVLAVVKDGKPLAVSSLPLHIKTKTVT